MKRAIRLLTAVMSVTLVAIIFGAPSANATYFFEPGQQMYFGAPGNSNWTEACTGGYAIHGTDGTFLLTAGHCPSVPGTGIPVFGTDAQFGNIFARKYDPLTGAGYDTEIIRETTGNDAYQIVVDPLSGQTPGTHGGKVTGYFPDSALVKGFDVGKMGMRTGWEEGSIFGEQPYGTLNGVSMKCIWATAYTDHGDSGGPVWRTFPNGYVGAVGITVLKDEIGDGCFIPIQDLLNAWGATLPVFPSSAAMAAVTPSPMAVPSRPQPISGLPFVNQPGVEPA